MSERPLVMKFGGTSVGDGACFVRAAKIVAGDARKRPAKLAVVASAMSGTTDTLLGYAGTTRTSTGAMREGSSAGLHCSLAERHLAAAREAVAPEHLPRVEERLLELLGYLVETVEESPQNAAAWRDAVAVYGERLSAEILAGAIANLGVPAAVVAEDPIATDEAFGDAVVDAEATWERCESHVTPLLERDRVAVVPGYVGRAPCGSPTTLGRGGSDLSATALGRSLGSEEVWIFSDVEGVLSADPRLVPEAHLLPQLSYREAATFAGLGAKILHPKTMQPATATGMEVRVANTFRPERPGTVVSGRESGAGIRCAALRRGFEIEVPCSRGHKSAAAAVVCIGSPTNADVARGMRCLREAGVPLLHSGISAPGLVFVVAEEVAEKALRVLHGDLVAGEAADAIAEGVA